MGIKCMAQIQLGGAAEAVVASAGSANKSTKGIMVGNFAINMLMSSALGLLWGMINGLQILSLMPLVDCDMPGNAQFLFMQIYTIASFNLIDVSFLTNKIDDKLKLKANTDTISSRF